MPVRRALALALLLVPALGATRAPAGDASLYAGGRIGAGLSPDAEFVRVETSADHRHARLTADLLLRCRGYAGNPVFSPGRTLRVPIRAGRFAGGAPVHSSGTAGRADGGFAFTGHRVSPRVLAGAVRERVTARLGGRAYRCDTGRVAWRATHPAGLAPTGAAVGGRALYGVTGQGRPFMLRAAPDGRTVAIAAFEWQARCGGGQTLGRDAELRDLDLGIGLIAGTARTRAPLRGGGTETTAFAVTGQVGPGVAAGRLRVAVTDVVRGRVTRSCRSGPVPWRALR